MSAVKILDIDSTYRDRNSYPNSCDFVIIPTLPDSNLRDPVFNALGYTGSETALGLLVTQAGSSTTSIVLDATETSIDNYYINSFLQIGSEFEQITYYNGTTKTATVSTPFSSAPAAGTHYTIRRKIPIFIGNVDTTNTTATNTYFSLNSSASSYDNMFNRSFVYFTSGQNSGFYSQIGTYTGSNRAIALNTRLPYVPANGDTVEIYDLSRENDTPLNITNVPPPSSYDVKLEYLSIPLKLLNVGNGGYITDYPYVYVSLYNSKGSIQPNTLVSNNPNSVLAQFKIYVKNDGVSSNFVLLKECNQVQKLAINWTNGLIFKITLPDGEVLSFQDPDTSSPFPPDIFSQVSASFTYSDGNHRQPSCVGHTIF